MSRKVMQQALEALEWNYNNDLDNIPACEQWAKMLNETITALKQALAEPEQNPFGDDAERYARKLREERESYKALFTEHKPQTTHWEGCEAVHPECRKPEQEPVAWMESPHGVIRANPLYRIKAPQSVAWSIPLYTAPTPRKPLTDEEVVALFNRLCQERSAWPERRYRDFARWVERAHGITGESK